MGPSMRVRTYLARDVFMLKGAQQMRISDLGRYALGCCAAFAMLAGCGGGAQSPLTPSGPLQQQSNAQPGVMALHPDHSRSWMTPGAATGDLLYISNFNTETVLAYSYPQDKLVGKLTGFKGPEGLCADKKGDVWVVNHTGNDVVEYKRGGTKPIATLHDAGESPISCSVDPSTGDLAVTDFESGDVSFYAHAKGSPKLYKVPSAEWAYFCGYDDKGNLFVDGWTGATLGFTFAELPKGKKSFTTIYLTGATIYFPGNVQWDGKYVAVGDEESQLSSSGYYQSAIYQTTGAGGKIVHKTVLTGSGDIVEFSIDGKTVIGPDYQWEGANTVLFWHYPAGGKPEKSLTKGLGGPFGSAISLVPK